MKYKQLIIGLSIGIAVGFTGTFAANRCVLSSDSYSIQIMNEATAIKLNKKTGQAWRFDRQTLSWQPISN